LIDGARLRVPGVLVLAALRCTDEASDLVTVRPEVIDQGCAEEA
jgi:hypothetical protein